MQVQLEMPTLDGFTVYGTYTYASKTKGEKLVVFAHGLTGKSISYVHMAGAEAMQAAGYDTFRMDFYAPKPHARRLSISTLETHAADLNVVLRHFAKHYKRIYLVGHSYGALAALILNPDVVAMSLWEASFAPAMLWDMMNPRYSKEIDACIVDLGCEYVIGKAMIEEAEHYTVDKCLALAQMIKVPTQLVVAACDRCSGEEIYFDKTLPQPSEKVTIPNASHTFSELGVAQHLFGETLRWFNQFTHRPPIH